MSIPEIDKAIVKFLDFCDEPIVLSVFKKDRQACYEAGKRDALPVWPPKTESVYMHKPSLAMFSFRDNLIWYYLPKTHGEWKISYPGSDFNPAMITAAYFMGELEEIAK